jgi:hypothetical protein
VINPGGGRYHLQEQSQSKCADWHAYGWNANSAIQATMSSEFASRPMAAASSYENAVKFRSIFEQKISREETARGQEFSASG